MQVAAKTRARYALWQRSIMSPENKNYCIAEYSKGRSCKDIAKDIEYSSSAVVAVLNQAGVEMRKNGKFTTAQETEIVKMYESGTTTLDIAAAFGVQGRKIRACLTRNGHDPERRLADGVEDWKKYRNRMGLADKDRLVALYESGVSFSEICNDLGFSKASVSRALKHMGISRRNPRRDFSEDELAYMGQQYRSGSLSATNLAAHFGVSPPTIVARLRMLGIPVSGEKTPTGAAAIGAATTARWANPEIAGQIRKKMSETLKETRKSKGYRWRRPKVSPKQRKQMEENGTWMPPGPGGHCYKDLVPPDDYVNYRGVRPRYVAEHVLVMEERLGRKIDGKVELVHHVNALKDDNRIENLRIVTRDTHHGEVTCPQCQFDFLIQ